MEYAIFPMKTIGISQAYSTGHKALDCFGKDTGKELWYAPCRIKILRLFSYEETGFYNTVLFGTCDKNGNPASVMCEDGIARVLTIGCTHIDSEDWKSFNYKEGNIYESGTACYKEGFKGLDPNNKDHGNHVHMDVGEGWQYERIYIDGGWHLKNTLLDNGSTLIGNTFYQLEGFNTLGSTKGYTFTKVTSRTVGEGGTVIPTPTSESVTGYGIYVNKLGLNIRSDKNSNSTILATVTVGNELKVKKFIPGFQSDGYQWAEVYYNGYTGYCQLDTKGYYTVVLTDTSVIDPYTNACIIPNSLYLVASSSGANIRSSIPNGTATFVPANSRMKVEELIAGFQSDGYQWIKASYNGNTGYVQVDLKSWHYFTM